MNYGYRIHYGCANETKFDLLRTHISEIPPDFERTPVVLPESKVPPGNSLYTVLKNMVAGLVVRSDKTYNLHCKRLCQARIFVFTDYGDVAANDEPMCLGRNQDTVLFSYKKFLSAWRQFLIEGSPRPNIEINLACGKKPKQRHNRVFVSMTLIPRAAKTMMQRISSVEDRSGADSSVDESSFDNILRLFYRWWDVTFFFTFRQRRARKICFLFARKTMSLTLCTRLSTHLFFRPGGSFTNDVYNAWCFVEGVEGCIAWIVRDCVEGFGNNLHCCIVDSPSLMWSCYHLGVAL